MENSRVEAVIPDHSEAFLRERTLALEDVVEILRQVSMIRSEDSD